MAKGTSDKEAVPQLTPLNGIRFFAVFHIFLFHLWAIRHHENMPESAAKQLGNAFAALDELPWWLENVLAHGYVSTAFFFVLSGFILSYLYWSPSGELATSKRRFWVARAARIYPAHLLALAITVLLTVPRFFFDPNAPSITLAAASTAATATLVQAWFPPLVPIIAWPTWALSALVFLYLIMPWLMGWLARRSRRQLIALLAALPVVSLVPTLVFLYFVPDIESAPLSWRTFLGSTPLFWVPHFAAGMILSRLLGISRFEERWREHEGRWFALGDLAFLCLVAVCLTQSNPWLRYILRHGLLMPLYLLVIRDFARSRGLFARFFSVPGMDFLGQTSFSIFIWQGVMTAIGFIIAFVNPAAAGSSLWVSVIGLAIVAAMSTYGFEKPVARRLRRRFSEPAVTTAPEPVLQAS